MKKIIKLTESDLVKFIDKTLNESENDRVVYGDMISNNHNKELISKGYTPYYLDLKIKGHYKVIKVKNLKDKLPKTTFYFLSDEEHSKLIKLTENINNLISNYLDVIDLYTKQLVAVLEQKIII